MRRSADVIVIGAGPAGIAAACRAAESGCSVLLVDEAEHPGGQIWRHQAGQAAPGTAARWLRRLAASGAEHIARTTIVDAISPLAFAGERDGVRLRLTARRAVVLATGARELFLPFPGWTLPGVVGIGGAQALLKQGWNVRGRRAVVAGSGPLMLPVAAALAHAGAHVVAVVEQAPRAHVTRFARSLWRAPGRLLSAARYRWEFRTASYRMGTWVARAEGAAQLQRVEFDGELKESMDCDVLCTGYGLTGATELAQLIGCAVSARGVTVGEMQQTSIAGVFCAGEPVVIGGVDAALVQGAIAGLAAAGRTSDARTWFAQRAAHAAFSASMRLAFAPRPEVLRLADAETIVCRCEDVPMSRIEACGSFREAKLHTRTGMGACQGRVCGTALRHLKGWSNDQLRPPIAPARLSTLVHAQTPDEENA